MSASTLQPDAVRKSYDVGNGNLKHIRIVNGTAYTLGMTLTDGTEDTRATPDAVVEIPEKYRHRDTPLRLFYGDAGTGRSWLDENDIVGTIGRSTGIYKIPLLCPPRGHGGLGILDSCIVRIDVRGRTLWQHPTFNVPVMEIHVGDILDLAYEAFADGKLVARFYRRGDAERYIAIVRGDAFPDPVKEPGAFGLDRDL